MNSPRNRVLEESSQRLTASLIDIARKRSGRIKRPKDNNIILPGLSRLDRFALGSEVYIRANENESAIPRIQRHNGAKGTVREEIMSGYRQMYVLMPNGDIIQPGFGYMFLTEKELIVFDVMMT